MKRGREVGREGGRREGLKEEEEEEEKGKERERQLDVVHKHRGKWSEKEGREGGTRRRKREVSKRKGMLLVWMPRVTITSNFSSICPGMAIIPYLSPLPGLMGVCVEGVGCPH